VADGSALIAFCVDRLDPAPADHLAFVRMATAEVCHLE
jgi:hypothetical protein